MRTQKTALVALVVTLLAIGGLWLWEGGDDAPATAQVNATWQVETDIPKDGLATSLADLDATCEIDLETQGVSFYIVAYRCPD